MEKILRTGSRRFPPRLPEQPIFYPVLNQNYAELIASTWNKQDANSGFVGFVTRFRVLTNYIGQFRPQIVGTTVHRELWVPAEELAAFNKNIVGRIEIITAHYGPSYLGVVADVGSLSGNNARQQLAHLENLLRTCKKEFALEVKKGWLAIQLNFGFWCHDLTYGTSTNMHLLREIATTWQGAFPDVRLVSSNGL